MPNSHTTDLKHKSTFIIKKIYIYIYLIENFSHFDIHQVAEHKLSTNFVSTVIRHKKQPEQETRRWGPNIHATLILGFLHQTSCSQFPQAECALVAGTHEVQSCCPPTGLFYLKGTNFSEPALKRVNKTTQNGLDQICFQSTLQTQIKIAT